VISASASSTVDQPPNWHPFHSPITTGEVGAPTTAGPAFVRGGRPSCSSPTSAFDAVSTAAQEAQKPAARHANRHPRLARHLHGSSTSSWPGMTGPRALHRVNVPHPVDVAIAKGGEGGGEGGGGGGGPGPDAGLAQYLVEIGAIAGLASVVLVIVMGSPHLLLEWPATGCSRRRCRQGCSGASDPIRHDVPHEPPWPAFVAGLFPSAPRRAWLSVRHAARLRHRVWLRRVWVSRFGARDPRVLGRRWCRWWPILGYLICGYICRLPRDTWLG
jgi:APA family basic amino acid/polyamine antiporter